MTWRGARRSIFSCLVLLFALHTNMCVGKPSKLCPTSQRVIITEKCKFLPGWHRFAFLSIREEIFLETTSANGVHVFEVNGTMEIAANAVIHVGFLSNPTTPTVSTNSNGVCSGNGGSFGGRGGAPANCPLFSDQSPAYGDVFNVSQAGSPGSGLGGGQGGAFLHIRTRKLVHEGVIRANGQPGHISSRAGGGSGGGVAVDCREIVGNGRIEVLGGAGGGQGGPGGGGGRVSVRSSGRTTAFSWPTVTFGGRTGNGQLHFSIYYILLNIQC